MNGERFHKSHRRNPVLLMGQVKCRYSGDVTEGELTEFNILSSYLENQTQFHLRSAFNIVVEMEDNGALFVQIILCIL